MSQKFDLEKKLSKVHHGFTDSVAGLPVKELEQNLLMYAKHREDTLTALKENKDIKDTQEALAELKGPYNDMINALKLKTAYIHLLIKEKNGDSPVAEESDEE